MAALGASMNAMTSPDSTPPARIDLRSDTVTLPTPTMRRAMAEAVVGDDVYGEDPTVNTLQDEVARLLGKEAALFAPSGTMCNQIALAVLGRPGDEIICDRTAHIVCYEAGGVAANAGLNMITVDGDRGRFTAEQVRSVVSLVFAELAELGD